MAAVGLLGLILCLATTKLSPKQRTRFPQTQFLPSKQPLLSKSGCSSQHLLQALEGAQIQANGPSTEAAAFFDNFQLDDFEYSFDLDRCSDLHVYTAKEACNLITRFGGLHVQGDSYMRHFTNALFILLRSSLYGGSYDRNETCRGENLFDDHKSCRFTSLFNSQDAREPICGGDAWITMRQFTHFDGP
jgi:hypothetical protein